MLPFVELFFCTFQSMLCLILSSALLCPSASFLLTSFRSVLGMLPSRLPPLWSTSRHRLSRVPGLLSASRASNSPSPTSPLRVPMTPRSPHRAWVSCTQAQAAGATVGARGGSGGVRLELPGIEGQGLADHGQIQGAGTT